METNCDCCLVVMVNISQWLTSNCEPCYQRFQGWANYCLCATLSSRPDKAGLNVRTSLSPQKVFSGLNKICYVGRGR